jgi:ribosomal-protein-serine acetyltransferase
MNHIHLNGDVLMRQFEPSDAGDLLAAVDATRDRLARWMPWVPFATTVEDFADFIRVATRHGRVGSGMHCGLFDGDRLVGTVGASIGSLNYDEADVGYWVAESHEGRGLVAEAVSQLIDWLIGERDMYRITIRAAVANERSRSLAERLGFTYEGILRGSLLIGDDHVDAALYSLLADEWSGGSAPQADPNLP